LVKKKDQKVGDFNRSMINPVHRKQEKDRQQVQRNQTEMHRVSTEDVHYEKRKSSLETRERFKLRTNSWADIKKPQGEWKRLKTSLFKKI